MSDSEKLRENRLNDLFDKFVAGEQPDYSDPAMHEAVRRFFASDDTPALPRDKAAKILEELMSASAIAATTTLQLSIPWSIGRNNHIAPKARQGRARHAMDESRNWRSRTAYLALAVMLLLSLAGGYLAVDRFRSGSEGPQTVPAAIAPAATPAATPVSMAATPVGSATVIVKLLNDDAEAVTVGCYGAVDVHESGRLEFLEASKCDADDGAADGSITLTIPASREIVVFPTSWPSTSHIPSSQVVNAEPGETLSYTFQTGQILIQPIRPADLSINEGSGIDPGVSVCYAVFTASGDELGLLLTYACDAPTVDKPRNGVTKFENLLPGSYLVVRVDENGEPVGDPVPVTIEDGGAGQVITWPDSTGVNPAGTATVIVDIFDTNGDPYPDVCYGAVVVHKSGQLEFLDVSRCDADDGAADGTIAVTVPAGQEIVVYPTSWPSTSRVSSSQIVNAEPGETLSYMFRGGPQLLAPTPSDVSIKEGSGIDPEVSVCYAVFNASGDELGLFLTSACDSPSADKSRKGVLKFENFMPGSFLVVRIDENGMPIGDLVPVIIGDEVTGKNQIITWPDE